ncbi:hypothetical protein [Persicirhabdus sediminis]|uniref:Uncharacterized protein n=1 Tax=Persicirhabdus sediminis TaxID=454144 RepID=A0A8J7MGH2_9BACT|nr:hypothetical protein [Persicirhabdus sediminis]MBK1792485.1 hypothetical protein [Persicirhabdus sediminis]
MTQLTVRRVEEAWVAKAKALAAERGVSMNTVLVEALAEKFGDVAKAKTNGLEKFVGSRPDGFGGEFDEAMEDCGRIDEDGWK